MTEPTAFELRESLRNGEASAVELLARSKQRVEELRSLGAFVEVAGEASDEMRGEDRALAEARAADRRIASTPRGERDRLPPLLGLPTAHKDLLRVRGFTTTHGSAAVPHLVASEDDPISRAVREAGAICVGKTQVPEFGIAGYSENLVAPPARNPFDTARTAGGSSGGTAAAIAAGIIPAAIGSDAGGSIRIPSGACGLVGLKPGRAVVPADAANGLVDELGAPRMAVSGPMARDARDAALFYDALFDGSRAALRAIERAGELRGLRIGLSLDSPFQSRMPTRFDADALAALNRAARALEAQGHTVEEASFEYGDVYPEAFTTVWTQALRRIPLAPGAVTRLGELARWFLDGALAASEQLVAASVDALHGFARDATAQWGRYDMVLTPALAFAPPATGAFQALGPEGDYRLQCEWAPQTSMVNVTGLPALAAPAGRGADGLPRGVQLIGRAGAELRLLQLAAQLEQAIGR